MNRDERAQHHALLSNLTRELFQTEVSASRHCRREARRNPGTGPAIALTSVAQHADRALIELTELARREDLPVSKLGSILGETFSQLRDKVFDHMLDAERSYRATLLGIRHGIDVVHMFGSTAALARREAIADWAALWLLERTRLVLMVEHQLEWFASNVERALARSH